MHNSFTSCRRQFLRSAIGSATAVSIGAAVPRCFADASRSAKASDDRVLIVIQMAGGNDGLNTIVPYDDDEYRKARPKLGISAADVLKWDGGQGFHPSLSGMRDLLSDGMLTVVQGVGYDNPNRSHFESMDIWHTCRRKDQPRPDGWLGRYLEDASRLSDGDALALHLGQEPQPFALASRNVRVPTVRELSEFQLRGNNKESLRQLLARDGSTLADQSNDLLSFLQSSTAAAMTASQRVTEAAVQYQSDNVYPTSQLGQKLRVIAQLIDSGLSTKIYYVQLDGFDTHSQQPLAHSALLREWSDAVSAFVRDLDAHDHGSRVCVMTFSEFGRRVAENASEGTDHGAAGPMFLCGGGITGGFVGQRPNLTDLQDGDIKHTIDFRQVYASVLQDWLGADAGEVLGAPHERLPLFT